LAQHNPELLKQLKADGIANQKVLTAIGNGESSPQRQPQFSPPAGGFDPTQQSSFPQQQFPNSGVLTPPSSPVGVDGSGFLNLLGTLAQRLTQASGLLI
jgi:hypothetical protein